MGVATINGANFIVQSQVGIEIAGVPGYKIDKINILSQQNRQNKYFVLQNRQNKYSVSTKWTTFLSSLEETKYLFCLFCLTEYLFCLFCLTEYLFC